MGAIVTGLGAVIGFIGSVWGAIVCFGIISAKAGTVGAILALIILPITLSLAPWYVAFAENNWFPVLLVYGSLLLAGVLRYLGELIGSER